LRAIFIYMKTCSKCKVEKSVNDFGLKNTSKDKLNNYCKNCVKDISINRYKKLLERNEQSWKIKRKEWQIKNSEKLILYQKKYRQEKKEELKIKKKEYYLKNKDYIIEKNKKYRCENKKEANIKKKEYNRIRFENDPKYKLSYAIRSMLYNAFRRGKNQFKKNARSEKILGCTVLQLMDHLESKFTEGMTFENHGEWHIDHIIPLSTAETEEDIIKLNHYTNLQPLWGIDNLKKSDKINF